MWTVITEALDLLSSAGAAVTGKQLDAPTPCTNWTVAQVLQHAAGDQLAWAAAIGTGSGPHDNPFEPSGYLDGTVDELLAPAIATARAAWAAIAADAPSVPTPLPQGALPAATAAAACALDAAVHAWDITSALGRPSALAPQLAPSSPQLPPAGRAAAAGRPRHCRTPAPVRCLRSRAGARGRRRPGRRTAALSGPRPPLAPLIALGAARTGLRPQPRRDILTCDFYDSSRGAGTCGRPRPGRAAGAALSDARRARCAARRRCRLGV